MAKNFDIMMDENFDLLIKDGDIVIDESDQQHIQTIMLSAPGDFKQHPLLGLNYNRFKNAPISMANTFKRDLKVQLEDVDGIYKVTRIDVSADFKKVSVEAKVI